MNNMFPDAFSNPFLNTNMDNMRLQLESQLALVNKVLSATSGAVDESRRILQSLSNEDLLTLTRDPEFIQAKLIYELAFMDFLSAKFSPEYLTTSLGKEASLTLLEAIKKGATKVQQVSLEKKAKLDAMVDLMNSDPELQKKILEKLAEKH